MNTNEPSKLPPAPLIQPTPEDVAASVIPLPPTSLCGAGEITTVNRKSPGEPDLAEIKEREESKTEFPIFDDGSYFKYLERPNHAPQALLVAANGEQIAVVKNIELADMICNSLNLFLLATLKNEGPLQLLTKPLIVPPGQ